jgi:hypothetical protein
MNEDVKALPVVAYLRNDGLKAMEADERAAWIEAGRGEVVEDYADACVRQSDAESALAELRAEVERLRADTELWPRIHAELADAMVGHEQRADTAEARLERAMQKLQVARDALAGGLWDYGPGQDEHKRCNEVIAELDAFLGEGNG